VSELAGVVLAGGGSTRVGQPKAWIDWHGRPLVSWLCERLAPLAAPLVVVRAAGQRLPALPPGVETAADARPGRGPLEGFAAGLRVVGGRAGAAVVASCDLPLLHPEFVRALAGRLGDNDAVVPVAGGRDQVLCGVYRTSVLAEIDRLLAADSLRVRGLLDHIRVLRVAAGELPHPESVTEVNTPEQLRSARERAG
jgi:molybdenum cofactor guanylyltransferase